VDLTDEQCSVMADFVRGLATPTRFVPTDRAEADRIESGKALFNSIGCADCHSPSLGPAHEIYSDMLLHDMGADLESSTGYYGSIVPTIRNDKFAVSDQPTAGEWRTAPLWGVADSAPYLHDGRASTLEEAIGLHGGEASDVTARFNASPPAEREAVIAFLKSLRAPSPDLTAAR
jgi:CxxC motif-containing protein (DUF1111 family)